MAAVTALDVEVVLPTVEISGKGKLVVYIDGGVALKLVCGSSSTGFNVRQAKCTAQ